MARYTTTAQWEINVLAFLQSGLYFGFFSHERGHFRSTRAHIGKEETMAASSGHVDKIKVEQ